MLREDHHGEDHSPDDRNTQLELLVDALLEQASSQTKSIKLSQMCSLNAASIDGIVGITIDRKEAAMNGLENKSTIHLFVKGQNLLSAIRDHRARHTEP